jgi:hypothetical protein
MATILQLATGIARACGLSAGDAAVVIRRARERGYLPNSGRGGRDSAATPPAATEHAILLLLAMLQRDKGPKEAVAGVETWAQFVPVMINDWALKDLPSGGSLREPLGVLDDAAMRTEGCFAVGLLKVIGILRHQLAEPSAAFLVPYEVSLGSAGGLTRATITVQFRGASVTPIERHFSYVAPGADVSKVPDGSEDGLRSVHALGGGALLAITELLGPLSMAGDGGPRVGSIASDDDRRGWLLRSGRVQRRPRARHEGHPDPTSTAPVIPCR